MGISPNQPDVMTWINTYIKFQIDVSKNGIFKEATADVVYDFINTGFIQYTCTRRDNNCCYSRYNSKCCKALKKKALNIIECLFYFNK